ncbi:MAG: inositol monophosphatase family protein [Mycobacterium sp.]
MPPAVRSAPTATSCPIAWWPEGAADIAAEPEVSVWDLAALDILVREAGGAFISLDGTAGPHGGSAVATNGLLHQQVLS